MSLTSTIARARFWPCWAGCDSMSAEIASTLRPTGSSDRSAQADHPPTLLPRSRLSRTRPPVKSRSLSHGFKCKKFTSAERGSKGCSGGGSRTLQCRG